MLLHDCKRYLTAFLAVNTLRDYAWTKVAGKSVEGSVVKKLTLVLTAGVLAITLLLFADDDGPIVTHQAPKWQAVSLQGDTLSGANLKGQVVVLDFWSTTCAPCVASLPQQNKFVRDLRGEADIIAVTTDSRATVQKFLANHLMEAKIGIDTTGRAAGAFQIQALPTAVIIDRFGNVVYKQTPPDYDKLEAIVKQYQ